MVCSIELNLIRKAVSMPSVHKHAPLTECFVEVTMPPSDYLCNPASLYKDHEEHRCNVCAYGL